MSTLSKRKLSQLIHLVGVKPCGYTVCLSGFAGETDIDVQSVLIGNAIVRALRAEAALRPDLFPPSKLA